jgi:hypothetical protein
VTELKVDEDGILAAMLRQAEQLCAAGDPLMAGQYCHLRERIRALIALRECARDREDHP